MKNVEQIVNDLGGTNAVAEICKIKPPSVSEWIANDKIPDARLQFLELKFPEVFADDQQNKAA